MNTLLIAYNLNFYKQSSKGRITHVARGGGLAEFLNTYTDLSSIDEGLISVDYYLNGGLPDYEHGSISSELYTAWLTTQTAKIYPSVGNTEILLQSIPLIEFKNILIIWRDFLKS